MNTRLTHVGNVVVFQIAIKTLPCSSRTGNIGRRRNVPGRFLGACRRHRAPRPRVPVATVQHVVGAVQSSGRRVQRRTVRADRSVMTLLTIILVYCYTVLLLRRPVTRRLKESIAIFHRGCKRYSV